RRPRGPSVDSASARPEQASSLPPDQPELGVQNGRLRGARRPLALPLTLLGREAGCEIRLNVDDVSPLHCAVVRTSGGLQLRDLQSETGTLVNGERITTCTLRDGDRIAVGPFRFRVRMPQTLPAEARSPEEESEALRG